MKTDCGKRVGQLYGHCLELIHALANCAVDPRYIFGGTEIIRTSDESRPIPFDKPVRRSPPPCKQQGSVRCTCAEALALYQAGGCDRKQSGFALRSS